MSDLIKRYDIRGWDVDYDETADGDYVLYDDHQAKVERMTLAYEDIYREYGEKCERVEELREALADIRKRTYYKMILPETDPVALAHSVYSIAHRTLSHHRAVLAGE